MKNFKKVIAFLMVAAMTLGMGLTAFADGEDAPFKVVSELDGDVLKFSIVTTQQIDMMAGGFETTFDSAKVATDAATVQSVAAEYGYYDAEFEAWLIQNSALKHLETSNYIVDNGQLVSYPATASRANSRIAADTPVISFAVQLKEGYEAGDVIGTVVLNSVTVFVSNTETQTLTLDDLQIVVPEADDPGPGPDDDSSSSDDSSSDVNDSSSDVNNSSSDKGDDVNNSSSDKGGNDAQNPSQGGNNAQNPSASQNAGNNNNATAPTLPKSDAITNVYTALENGILGMADQGKFDNVANALKGLKESDFVSKDAYNAFKAAYDAFVAAPAAEKANAYNKMILTVQENLLSKAGQDNLVKAVKAELDKLNGVANAANAGNAANPKMGDTAPVAALMLVAIAAFGTAVVVYRKKVNA